MGLSGERLRNIRLVLSYDGTDFSGWQRQDGDRTVQEELEKALASMHGHPVTTNGAGRTDAGVHALGQVAGFRTDIASIPAARFVPALNRLLPRDVRILESGDADPEFHPRFDAVLRRYQYFILPTAAPDPFRLRYARWITHTPDLDSLNAMASVILGEHDFTTFSSARDTSLSRRRYVHEASFRWSDGLVVFRIAGNAFLLRMVRSLVESMLLLERESRSPAEASAAMLAALEAADRSRAGPTAPPQGLVLWNVEYGPVPGVSRRHGGTGGRSAPVRDAPDSRVTPGAGGEDARTRDAGSVS